MESFCSSVVKEAIDGHAAVLMTHTKTGTGNHVGSDAKKHMSRQGWNA